MPRRGRKKRKDPLATALLVGLTVVAGIVLLYLFTNGIGLREIEQLMRDLLTSRWDVVAVPLVVPGSTAGGRSVLRARIDRERGLDD